MFAHLATLLLVSVWTCHVLYRILRSPGDETANVIGAVVGVIMLGALFTQVARRRIRSSRVTLANPLSVSLVLLGTSGLAHWFDGSSLGAVIFLTAVTALASLGKRILGSLAAALSIGRLAVLGATSLGVSACIGLLVHLAFGPSLGAVTVKNFKRGMPNVIVVVMDTVRADHTTIEGYGRNTTPQLWRLSKNATLYRNATATSNYTLPTHASMFTGLYPRRHGGHPQSGTGRQARLGEEFDTLAEILSQSGYRTIATTANSAFLSEGFGLKQGFQSYENRNDVRAAYSRFSLSRMLRSIANTQPINRYSKAYLTAAEINRMMLDLLDARKNADRPLCLFLNYMDAHAPLVPPQPFNSLFWRREHLPTRRALRSVRGNVGTRVSTEDQEAKALVAQYDAAIAYVDDEIGQFVESLRKLDVFENSIFVATSDHGEAFGEHGLTNHGASLYQDQIWIPLLIRFPNQDQAAEVFGPVSQVDLLPTILKAVGISVPDGLDGHGLEMGSLKTPTTVVAEHFDRDGITRAIRMGDLKLIQRPDGDLSLFDLVADQLEITNLATTKASETERLANEMAVWLAQSATYETRPLELDKRTRERLKALGYIQ